MDEEFLKLTNVVYRLIEFFPEADPLKNRSKEKALSLMENLTVLYSTEGWASFQKEKVKAKVLEDIDILSGYFWLAKAQGWVSHVNCLIVTNAYEKIKRDIGAVSELSLQIPMQSLEQSPAYIPHRQKSQPQIPPKVQTPQVPRPTSFSERQKRIILFLKAHQKAQVMDLQKILPGVTKRTIRRDLDELLETGDVKRLGEFNKIFYQIGH